MPQPIAVNARALQRRMGGVERYTHEILKRFPVGFDSIAPRRTLQGWRGHLWEQWVLPAKLEDSQLLWSPANSGPISVSHQVLTLHDVSALEHPEWYSARFRLWYRFMLSRIASRVRGFLTDSAFSLARIREFFPDIPIHVVPCGVDSSIFQPFSRAQAQLIHRDLELPERYVLYVGSPSRRKNLGRLLQAWRLLQERWPDHVLVLVGTGFQHLQEDELQPLPRNVIRMGYVDDALLPPLYAVAEVCVLPSLYEGFGLTVLEAMASGTPVVVSEQGALKEVVGDTGLYIDPMQVDSIVRGLEQVLSRPDLRDQLREAGLARSRRFSWERSADLAWNALQKYLD